MIHKPAIEVGAADQVVMEDLLDFLKVLNRAMVEHVAHRMGIDPVKLMEMIDHRMVWLDWVEAVKFNAVDVVVDKAPDILLLLVK
jgi:uncharacterized protein YcaQ